MSSESDTILLIEDSQSTRLAYKKIFTDAGYDVKEAETGEEGWDKAISLSPDLIVLDLILPDIHGLEVLKRNPCACFNGYQRGRRNTKNHEPWRQPLCPQGKYYARENTPYRP